MNRTNRLEITEQASQLDQNQFLLSPSRMSGVFNSKDETIKKLQEKNQRLRNQINRIDQVLGDAQQKTVYGVKIPQVKNQVTRQELDNAYKRIRAYEYEVEKLKNAKNNVPYVDQIRKAEILLKEKEDLSEKLKRELAEIKKQSKGITKQLKNDNIKQQYENKTLKLNTQIKWLRQKVKQAETQQEIRRKNRQKQQLFLKKLEAELLDSGLEASTLQAIKNKYTLNETDRQGYSRMSHIRDREEQFVQDRTPQAYKAILNEIKLFQKLEKDYNNQLETLIKENQEASVINIKSRNRLLETEDQIEKVEKMINQLKSQIDPAKLRPQRAYSVEAASVGRYGKVNKSLSSIKPAFNHLYKHEEIGKVSKNGRRFSDRPKIGKNPAKIISIDFYEAKDGACNFVGFQASYETKSSIKKGPLNMIVQLKNTVKKQITLIEPNDYIKSIQCILNEKGIVIGLGVTSVIGTSLKVGPQQGIRRPLNISRLEYPACIYGSFQPNGIQLFGVELLEQKEESK